MAGNARKTTDKPPAKSVFFEDPDRPGQSRHLKCFRKAGIDPLGRGLQPTDGPCWVCVRSAWESILYEANRQIALDHERLADTLKVLADRALSLSRSVRLTHWTGIIQRAALEDGHGRKLRLFRRSWQTALSLSATTVPQPRQAATEQPPETGLLKLLLSVANRLSVDPTGLDELDVAFIELLAGWFAMAARALREQTTDSLTMLRDNKGKDGTEALMLATAALSAHQITVAYELVSLCPELRADHAEQEDADGQDAMKADLKEEDRRVQDVARRAAVDAAAQRLVHAWDERRSHQGRDSKKPQRAK